MYRPRRECDTALPLEMLRISWRHSVAIPIPDSGNYGLELEYFLIAKCSFNNTAHALFIVFNKTATFIVWFALLFVQLRRVGFFYTKPDLALRQNPFSHLAFMRIIVYFVRQCRVAQRVSLMQEAGLYRIYYERALLLRKEPPESRDSLWTMQGK